MLPPAKTLTHKQEELPPGYKGSKERVTVLACSNKLSDTNLCWLVRPRKQVNLKTKVETLPVKYLNQKSAWMDSKLFSSWFQDQFVPSFKRFSDEIIFHIKHFIFCTTPQHILMKMHHLMEKIRALFLPPNVIHLIQPLDQSILENLKHNYQRRLFKSCLKI